MGSLTRIANKLPPQPTWRLQRRSATRYNPIYHHTQPTGRCRPRHYDVFNVVELEYTPLEWTPIFPGLHEWPKKVLLTVQKPVDQAQIAPQLHKVLDAPVPLQQFIELYLELQHYIYQQCTMQLNVIEVHYHAALRQMTINNIPLIHVMVDGSSSINVLSEHLHMHFRLRKPKEKTTS